MRFLVQTRRRRVAGLVAGCVLALGSVASLAMAGAGTAGASTCTAGGACAVAGTATLSAGTLNMTTPSTLTWTATLTGAVQDAVDTTAADRTLTVDDATGSGTGWHVTVAATTFSTTGGTKLANTGTFSVNGSLTTATTGATPDAACTITGQCTLPSGTEPTYPVAVTTAATTPTPSTLYTAAAASGLGSVLIGGTTPVGWWISLPGNAKSGAYGSAIDLTVASGP